jgi:hypothetical protein
MMRRCGVVSAFLSKSVGGGDGGVANMVCVQEEEGGTRHPAGGGCFDASRADEEILLVRAHKSRSHDRCTANAFHLVGKQQKGIIS